MGASLRQIARVVGYSSTTVSNALQGRAIVRPETRERILAVARQLGYRPNPALAHVMADIRLGHRPEFVAKLALVNGHRDRDAFLTHPTIPAYVMGCKKRAEELGYSFDTFWLHDRSLNARSWLRILETRAIRGLIIVGLMDDSHLPPHFAEVWRKVPAVVTGVRTKDPTLPFAAVDHHQLALAAFERALELGYRRPALVLDAVIDRLVDGRIHAGFLVGQNQLPARDRIPAFTKIAEARKEPEVFRRWLRRHQPDVLFSLYNEVFRWLQAAEMEVPGDIGVIQLEWRASRPHIAGLDQNNDRVGEAALDMLVSLLRKNGGTLPADSWASLINPVWRQGLTVRPAAT